MMERRQGPWWGSKPDGSHAPGERPGKGKSEGLNGNDARRLAIRPDWFSVVLAPEREQSGQSGQGEQADDDKVGSEAERPWEIQPATQGDNQGFRLNKPDPHRTAHQQQTDRHHPLAGRRGTQAMASQPRIKAPPPRLPRSAARNGKALTIPPTSIPRLRPSRKKIAIQFTRKCQVTLMVIPTENTRLEKALRVLPWVLRCGPLRD